MRSVQLTSVVLPEEGGFYAVCPELNVASQGDTRAEALSALKEAVELYIEDYTAAELEAILKRDSVERHSYPLAA